MEVWAATKLEDGHWYYQWSEISGVSYEIWLNGELLDTVVGGEYEAELDGYDTSPPPVEIVPDESGVDPESELYPPYAVLQWRGVSGAEAYLVEQYRSGSWIALKTIMERSAGYYTFKTEVQTDSVATSFRVSALDVQGNSGTPLTFTFYVVRNPAPPDVDLTMTAGDIVVS